MTRTSLPTTGPLWLDARGATPMTAVRVLDDTVTRMQRGHRMVVVKADARDVVDALLHWADDLDVPLDRVAAQGYEEIRFFLLPRGFDQHPLASGARRTPVLGAPVRVSAA